MDNLIILFYCFFVGFILRVLGRLPENTPSVLNSYLFHIALPAKILLYIHNLGFEFAHIFPVSMAWIVCLFGIIFYYILSKFLTISKEVLGCLFLMSILGNTSFFGLPMIEVFYGKEMLGIGVLADQPGSFLLLSVVGIPFAMIISSGKFEYKSILKKVFMFAPFQAFVLSLAIHQITFAPVVERVLDQLSDTLAPIALFSVGFQFKISDVSGRLKLLTIGLLFKLILAPIFIYILFVLIVGEKSEIIKVTIFESAMPPMVTASLIALEYKLDPPLGSLMVAFGLLISFVTLTIWYYYLGIAF